MTPREASVAIDRINKRNLSNKKFQAAIVGASFKTSEDSVQELSKEVEELIDKDRKMFFSELKKRFNK